MLSATLVVAFLQLALVVGTARAQDGDADAAARVAFDTGRVAYEAGHYAEALTEFERSYTLSGRPALLYNIAQAADRLRHDERAVEAFEQFLAAVPDTELRESVEQRVTALRAAIASRTNGGADTSAAETAHTPSSRRPAPERNVLGPVLLLGAGGLLAIGGTVSLAVGLGDRASVEGAALGTMLAEVQGAADRAPLLMNGGLVLLGVGLAAAAVGLVWLLVPSSSSEEASIAVAPTAGGVLVTGVF